MAIPPTSSRCWAVLFREAVFHERFSLIAFHFLVGRFLVARFHFFLLRGLFRGLVGFLAFLSHVFAFQARAHELLAFIAFAISRLRPAILHAFLLRLLLPGGLFFG